MSRRRKSAMVSRGVFIVLEGADGVGKGTQLRHLTDRLQALGRACYPTAEPTHGAIGQLIRQRLRSGGAHSPQSMACLFAADRHEHAANEIVPALATGAVVLCDRYDLSNLVYRAAEQPLLRCAQCAWADFNVMGGLRWCCPQCGCADLARPRSDALTWARTLSRGAPRPDLTIVLDLPDHVARARRLARGVTIELYDDQAMQIRVADLYRRAEELLRPERVAVVDGDADEETVASRVWCAANGFIS
jgi:dTMP kinase